MTRQPQDIEQIINSFETYALGDIRHNKSKPIAAFLLGVCFIDQLSAFRYDASISKKKRPEMFIDDYMKEYNNLGLYNYVRHCLVHYYSSEGRFDIMNDRYPNVPYVKIDKTYHINTDVFISYLEKAFKDVLKDFRIINSDAYNNAKDRS